MKKITLITVFNNKKQLSEMENSACKSKNVEIEFIFVDNTNRRFSSAAKALNYGVSKATSDVLVFLHQDIEFLSEQTLADIYDYAIENPKTIFGVAGVKKRGDGYTKILSAIYGGPDKVEYNTLTEPTKVSTLDECLMACHKKCFGKVKFDEVLCDGWHLYGADLCLQANYFTDLNVEAIPIKVWHKSNGNADKSYFNTQSLLAKKYRKYTDVVNTTNGYSYTNSFKRLFQNLYRKLRYKS